MYFFKKKPISKHASIKNLSTLFILFFSLLATAQIQYEKGYIIDNSDNKTECLVRFLDWDNNPEKFEYKLTENGDIITGDVNSISKLEIYNKIIFVSKTVDIDINTSKSNELNKNPELELTKKRIFLHLLVQGKANLYFYNDANTRRFYYQMDSKEIILLEYKKYIRDDNRIAKNENYKGELWNNLKCSSLDLNSINKVKYKQADLIAILETFNSCKNELTYTFKREKRKDVYNLTLRPGINFSSLSLDNPGTNQTLIRDLDYDQEVSIRFGVQLEYMLPTKRRKWSVTLEPTYHYYKTEKNYSTIPNSESGQSVTATVDYSSIEIPIGIRHYSLLNTDSKLFISGSYVLDISLKTDIVFSESLKYKGDTGNNLAFGIGYVFKDKYSIEARLNTSRELLKNFDEASGDFKSFSLIFGYTIF
ncbi:PorT family protein [Psychroserpens burtonensis]|uniref:PorT family protein n=1 Tax=Psychroserpens burtonensis TaxID=49278 RepID=A0A5C7B2S4_9FLAO|nr:PorT family protein [Psychroserpens burtonensis]TXE15559.1 PorT family protein [Psychroserpens burtonensis]